MKSFHYITRFGDFFGWKTGKPMFLFLGLHVQKQKHGIVSQTHDMANLPWEKQPCMGTRFFPLQNGNALNKYLHIYLHTYIFICSVIFVDTELIIFSNMSRACYFHSMPLAVDVSFGNFCGSCVIL